MALLDFTYQFVKNEELVKMVVSHLRREYSATVSRPVHMFDTVRYKVEGKGLPKGTRPIGLDIEEIVKNVFIIRMIA